MTQTESIPITLICDTPHCGWSDLTELSAEHIGRKCPDCGENLLTAEDFEQTKKSMEALALLGFGVTHPGDPDALFSINPHAGNVTVKSL